MAPGCLRIMTLAKPFTTLPQVAKAPRATEVQKTLSVRVTLPAGEGVCDLDRAHKPS